MTKNNDMSSMNRVFVIQDDGRRDFSKAKKFGELVPMIERDVFPDDAEERQEVVYKIIRRKLDDFMPLYDSVLLTGDPVALVTVGMELQRRFPDERIRILKYDRENRDYYDICV